MKSLVCLLLGALMAHPPASLAAPAAHHHRAAASHKLQLNAGKKWATDRPLQQGMNAIGASLAAILPLAHAGKATPDDYAGFARDVTAQVAYIVQHCKLDAKADAQLHLVIGAIMAGAEMAEGRHAGASRPAGVRKVAQALDAYGRHFDHPHWKAGALAD